VKPGFTAAGAEGTAAGERAEQGLLFRFVLYPTLICSTIALYLSPFPAYAKVRKTARAPSSAVERCTEDRHVAISPAMLRSSHTSPLLPAYVKVRKTGTTGQLSHLPVTSMCVNCYTMIPPAACELLN